MKKRSVMLAGHRTSVSLEDRFWSILKEAALEKKCPLQALIEIIDQERDVRTNLSSALRLYVLGYLEGKISKNLSSCFSQSPE